MSADVCLFNVSFVGHLTAKYKNVSLLFVG